MLKRYLLTPGPTPVPSEALLAMAKPIIHHRTPQFKEVIKGAVEGLRYVFQTKNDIFIFASSGTGAMESSVTNLLSAGDKAIVIRGGKFGERFTEICEAYGVIPINIDVEWGEAVDPLQVQRILNENKDVKAVYTTLCETSTAVLSDIKAIGNIVSKTDAILVVDVISSLGSVEFKADEWKVDVAVGGSQKGLMIPPGLAFIAVSAKAMKMVESSTLPKYYFCYKAAKKSADKDDTPWTPAVTLIIGLVEALKMMKEETLEGAILRQRKMAEATRAASKALGLELLAPTAPSDSVTAIKLPENIDGVKLVKTMRDTYGVGIAGGQAQLKGRIVRIASMGFMTQWDTIVAISCFEIVLKQMGHDFEFGSSIKAAEEIFSK
ncbi:MAG: alanine--glyoxylate aminotransferase family protein [Candidatus Orphnella occulta]|nr:alanine--glyoxylate aminotransferase family protein [Candidatus Orphnella occulta]MDP8297581.1 alanine--glyoxylate aminotransferase family protein [Candidatus Orphnella occulta]